MQDMRMSDEPIAKSNVELQPEDIFTEDTIIIKGSKEDLIIELPDAMPFAKVKLALAREFKKAPLFFSQSVAHIGYNHTKLNVRQQKQIRELCEKYGVLYQDLPDTFKGKQAKANALLITRTLRSGQRIEYNGHVVLLGDVQPGAEIVAAGHVLVWGTLRGVAHAGAAGNDRAVICAMKLVPIQLRIAQYVAVELELKDEHAHKPEIVFIRNQQIVAEEWDLKSFVRMGVALES